MIVYLKWLKHIPIVDVFFFAAGFVFRVHSGVTLIYFERFSPWLYVVMSLLSLFLGFGKRRAELSLLAHGAGSHRKVLEGYTLPLLDQYIMIVSATTIIAYSLYTFNAPNVPQNDSMMLTIPFVDRKSTRLNSSHQIISYAVFCLKKKIPAPALDRTS